MVSKKSQKSDKVIPNFLKMIPKRSQGPRFVFLIDILCNLNKKIVK